MKYWTLTGSDIQNIKVELSSAFIKRHKARMVRGKKKGASNKLKSEEKYGETKRSKKQGAAKW